MVLLRLSTFPVLSLKIARLTLLCAMVYLTVLLGLFLFVLQHVIRLATNHNNALKTGLPFVMSPVDPMHPLWVISQKMFLPLLKRLPFGLGAFTRYSVRGWVYYDKYKMHAELGDAWINVTPGENMLFIADPDAANDVFSRRKDFVKPIRLYSEFPICQAGKVSRLRRRWLTNA